MVRHFATVEETTYGTTPGSPTWHYYKILSESLNTTREDIYPETIAYWSPDRKVEGSFRTSGDVELLLEPVVFPWLLLYGMGDPSSTQQGGTTAYKHTWKFASNEIVSTTGIKSFTGAVGVGIEKDRRIDGAIITGFSFEAVAREAVTATVSILGSEENLITALTPDFSAYTQPYYSFKDTNIMTIGGTSRLTTQPTIEAFRLNCTRGYDADMFILGNRFYPAHIPSGMATVEGSMDLTFESEDEHERFLSAVGASVPADQASFAVILTLRGALIASTYYYDTTFTIPACQFTASTASVSARDRIVQTVDFKGTHDLSTSCALQIDMTNITTTYV